MTQPYVYFLKNKTTGLKYIGVKYAKNCHPSTFWSDYYTSSTRVKELIDIFGPEDFSYKILKTFDCSYEALVYENTLNRLAFYRDDYLNCHSNFIGQMTEGEYNFSVEKQKKSARLLSKIRMAVYGTAFPTITPERRLEIASNGGFAAAKINKIMGRAIFDPEIRRRQHETLKRTQKSAYYDPSTRSAISSLGGKVGCFSAEYYKKKGLTEEDRREAQRQRGKKGGPGNKGFIWYNDGTKIYKYTAKQQLLMSFDEFLKQNPSFDRGRGKNTYIPYTDGIKNFSFNISDGSFDEFLKQNPIYRSGITYSVSRKGVIKANDGIKNYFVTPEEMIKRNLTKGSK